MGSDDPEFSLPEFSLDGFSLDFNRRIAPCYCKASWHSVQDRLDSLRAHLGGVDFNYSDPYRPAMAVDRWFACRKVARRDSSRFFLYFCVERKTSTWE